MFGVENCSCLLKLVNYVCPKKAVFTHHLFDNWSAIFDLMNPEIINSTSKRECADSLGIKDAAESIPLERWFYQHNKGL